MNIFIKNEWIKIFLKPLLKFILWRFAWNVHYAKAF